MGMLPKTVDGHNPQNAPVGLGINRIPTSAGFHPPLGCSTRARKAGETQANGVGESWLTTMLAQVVEHPSLQVFGVYAKHLLFSPRFSCQIHSLSEWREEASNSRAETGFLVKAELIPPRNGFMKGDTFERKTLETGMSLGEPMLIS